MHIDRIPVYRVYQRAIDLELYHSFAELVVQTSQDDTARRTYRQTRAMQIWQVETDVSGYFEPYHLRYPGEVLERFEEKLGDDVQVFRALALALGNTCAIQSDNMFVGNQRGAFLQKLRRSAGEDVYLQGALYLLETDAAQRHALLEKLAEREYMRTEEALFVLSLFDDTERGYEAMHTQLSRLFTQNRTLSLVYDFGVLEWFIRFYAEQAKKYRGKADLVLRTLMKLPYMNVKPDSREFSVLTKAGYRCDEIILANSLAVRLFNSILAPLRMLIQVIRMEAYRSRKEISITMPTTKKQAKKVISPRSFRSGCFSRRNMRFIGHLTSSSAH
jgi:hypothetical protein